MPREKKDRKLREKGISVVLIFEKKIDNYSSTGTAVELIFSLLMLVDYIS